MIKQLGEIKELISSHKDEIHKEYKIMNIGIFGSYVRNEQNEESDLDILVEFDEPISMFKFVELEYYLEELIGIKIDLVSKKALKPVIGSYINSEVEYV